MAVKNPGLQTTINTYNEYATTGAGKALTNAQFVQDAYAKLLNLSGAFDNAQARMDYWIAKLEAGTLTKATFADTFLYEAKNFQGTLVSAQGFADNQAAVAKLVANDANNKSIDDIVAVYSGKTFTLTANADNFTGTAGNDVFDGGLLNSFSAFDNLDGGAGNDTLNVLTNAATVPGGVSVKNIENININHTGGAFAVDASTFTGAQALTLKNAAQAGNAITVNGTAAVTIESNVVTGAATGGTISVGATTAPTGAVVIKETASIDGGQAAGAITVKGGTSVSVTQVASNATAPILTTGANTTATQGAVTVTGTATTTDVTVNQTAAVTQVNTVVGVPAVYTVDFAGAAAAAAGDTFSVGGVLVHTAAGVETDAAIAAGAIATGNITVGGVVYTPTAGAGNQVVYTAQTAVTTTATGFAITTVGGTNATADVAVAPTTNGATAVTGVSGLAAGAVTITDVNAASLTEAGKITTVSLENFGAATINSSALASLTLAGKGTSVAETAGALTTPTATTLALNLNGVTTTGAVTLDADHTTLNIAAGTAASNLNSLSAAGAKTVNISGDKTVTLGNQTLDASATITSTNTAGVILSTALGNNVTFTGGAGKDSVTLGASTKAINMGAGDDTVTLTGSALGVNGAVVGGEGRDTLKMTDANAVTATNGIAVANFSGKVTGFEALEVAATTAGGEIKVASLNNTGWNAIDTVTFAGAVGHAMTVSGLVSGNTVGFKAANTQATTVTVTGAAASTTDVLNLSISNAAGVNVNTINAADVETVNFLTDDSATTATGIQHTASLTAAAVKTITVAGDAGLALTNGALTVTSFDASGVTKGAVSWTTAALADAASIKGSAVGANTFDFSLATKAVTYTGGSGADVINFANANTQANVVNLGDGANSFNGTNANGNNTITGGTGVDLITVGTGANTIVAGAGNDVITVGASAGLNKIDVGTGTDSVILTVAPTAAGFYSSITGMGAGDSIKFGATALPEVTLGAKITLGDSANFANYLDAAVVGSNTGNVNWFQFNGNTYVTKDVGTTNVFENGTDFVVELVGLVDLSTSSVAATGVLTLA